MPRSPCPVRPPRISLSRPVDRRPFDWLGRKPLRVAKQVKLLAGRDSLPLSAVVLFLRNDCYQSQQSYPFVCVTYHLILRATGPARPPLRCLFASLRASVAQGDKGTHPVMLSAAKHLDAQRARPFAALKVTSRGCPHRRGLKPPQPLLVGDSDVAPRHAVPSHDGLACAGDCARSVAKPTGTPGSAAGTRPRAPWCVPVRNKSAPASNC